MGDQTLYVSERGDGAPVVLLHGLMATGEMFQWLAEPLVAQFRLIVPDLPGHGRSRAVSGPYTVAAMTTRVAAALDERGIRDAHVMGYSHGGAIAQQLARDAAHCVRSLALVATYAYNTATRREWIEGWIAPRLVRLLGMRRMAALVIRPGVGGGPPLTADQIVWLRGMLAGNDTGTMAKAAAELTGFDSRLWLSQLRVPTLVVAGEKDAAVPAHHAAMLAKGISGARTATIAEAGHTMIWTHPQRLAEILIGWWTELDDKA
jgi:3-oxoadipate enol-lactonase